MNRPLIARVVGLILRIEAACMAPCLLIALLTRGSDVLAFCISVALSGAVGGYLILAIVFAAVRSISERFTAKKEGTE